MRDRALEQLRQNYLEPGAEDFNLDIVEGAAIAPHSLTDLANALPTFASWRIVVVRDAHKLSAQFLDQLLPYLKDPSPSTLLVFVGDKVDKRKKFFQEIQKSGALVEFKEMYENQIPAFVKEQAHLAGVGLTEEAMVLFCRRVGTHLQEIQAEIVKLATYLGDSELADVADIEEIVSQTRSENVFKLTDAIGERRSKEALNLLRKLLDDGEAPLMIVVMLTRYYRQLWSACELIGQGLGKNEMARKVGINPYFLDGLLAQARRSSVAQCRYVFDRLLETDLALKSSGAHPAALLDRLVLDMVGAQK